MGKDLIIAFTDKRVKRVETKSAVNALFRVTVDDTKSANRLLRLLDRSILIASSPDGTEWIDLFVFIKLAAKFEDFPIEKLVTLRSLVGT